MGVTFHTQWADAVIRRDYRAAMAVPGADDRLTRLFIEDLNRAAGVRQQTRQPAFDKLCRFDSADPVTSVQGWGIAENYFVLAKNVTVLPFVGTPLMENLPIVGPEEYPPRADEYIVQVAQNGIGEEQEASGNDLDFPVFESVTTPMRVRSQLYKGKVQVNWLMEQRGNLPGAVNLDKAQTDLQGMQKRLGELRPERSAHEGNPDRGIYGLVNHPAIKQVAVDPLTYGTTNMQSWPRTEAGVRDMANTLVSFLQDQYNRALGIEGYVPDTVIIPQWLASREGTLVYGLTAGGTSYPVAPFKKYVLDQCPWIKNWLHDPWLNAVNNTTQRLAIVNGAPDPSVLSSRIMNLRLTKDALHFAQPIAYQQLPPWMAGPARFETAAYHENAGIVVKLAAAHASLLC